MLTYRGHTKHHINLNGCNYFLTIVDDHSRATWTFLLPNKLNVAHTLETFILQIHNQYGTTIKTIGFDNGSNYVNKKCQFLFQKLGIQYQLSCPYTPQQNGEFEIKNKQLLQLTRAILFQSFYLTSFGVKLLFMPHT